MSYHIHDSEGRDIGYVCTGTGTQYYARKRWTGYRKWTVISSHKSYDAAIKAMSEAFRTDPNAKRADVIMTADYYDPLQLCELVRK